MTLLLHETITLPTNQSSWVIAGIPQDGHQLIVDFNLKSNRNDLFDDFLLAINGSSANLSELGFYGNPNAGNTVRYQSTTGNIGRHAANGASSGANTFSSGTLMIGNYSLNQPQTVTIDCSSSIANISAYPTVLTLHRSASAPVESLTFTPAIGTQVLAGSQISIYTVAIS